MYTASEKLLHIVGLVLTKLDPIGGGKRVLNQMGHEMRLVVPVGLRVGLPCVKEHKRMVSYSLVELISEVRKYSLGKMKQAVGDILRRMKYHEQAT